MNSSANTLEALASLLANAKSAVAFTGAGVSTESGIPDFRSPGGVWSKYQTVYFDEFLRDPEARYEYWRQKAEAHVEFSAAQPNIAHQTLAKWESQNRLRGVITQNIDELHQIAGSKNVLELHGTARKVMCLQCSARFDADEMVRQFLAEDRVPICPECGGNTKHATISFGQSLDPDVLRESARWTNEADVFLAMGSSLVVEPAASLPRLAREHGAKLIILNRDPTPLDSLADIVIHDTLGSTFRRLNELLEQD
ncbi:MAG: NAD-dependent deacylase [Planctomycetaceae bacterium]